MRRIRPVLTRVELRRHCIEHVSVHVGVDCPVGRGVVASGDEDRVTLSDSDSKKVDGHLFGVNLQGNT